MVFFTDLDGTLLDDQYRWQAAKPAIRALADRRIPLVLSTSKTRSEILSLRAEMDIQFPVIVENGGGVGMGGPGEYGQLASSLQWHVLGRPRSELLPVLEKLKACEGFDFTGFADGGLEWVMENTGLDRAAALRACDRYSTEPLLWAGSDKHLLDFRAVLAEQGWQLVKGGRFWHVMGPVDKGSAMRYLLDYMQDKNRPTELFTVALGDSENDLSMLAAAQVAVVMPDRAGNHLSVSKRPGQALIHAPQSGPEAWAQIVFELLEESDHGSLFTRKCHG